MGEKIGVEVSAANELRSIIERMERLAEEKDIIKDDEKSVMSEAKARGYDTKAIRTIIRMRKKDPNELANEQSVLDTYLAALGMLGGAA
ncbi:MAG: DUF2312 domain-containing protein [Agrobacterium vaccinii]